MMTTITSISGFQKRWINVRIMIHTFFYFTGRLIRGKMNVWYFPRFIRRLLFFLSLMYHNKYVKAFGKIKINLYVPAFPSKAFFNACTKVIEFERKMPCVSSLISITSACRFKCPHCYQKLDKGKDLDIETLTTTIKKIQNNGISFFNIEGGEPFLVFDRLKKVCESIDERSEIIINSTGDGITQEKLSQLREHKNIFGIMFSLHTNKKSELNQFMGREDAWEILEKGIELCHKANFAVLFNTCLLPQSYKDGSFEAIMDEALRFKGTIIQLIKPKPAGGWLGQDPVHFSKEELLLIQNKVDKFNHNPEFRHYPNLYSMFREESSSLFGCTAGGTDRFYVNAKGDVQPCEFLNLSFGNVKTEKFESIFREMREVFHTPGNCLICEKYSKEILNSFKESKQITLPLNAQKSKQICKNMDRGKAAHFYTKINEI